MSQYSYLSDAVVYENGSVLGATFSPTSGWTMPQFLENDLKNDNGSSPNWHEAYAPKVAVNGDGEALVVWTQFDGTATSVFAASYR